MPVAYVITVTLVVAVSSVIVFLILYRMKVLNFKTLLSVTLASFISAFGLPTVFNLVSDGINGAGSASPVAALLVSVAGYLLIVFILSIVISLVINGTAAKRQKQDAPENAGEPEKASAEDDNYLEQIFVNFIGAQEQNVPDSSNTPAEAADTALEAAAAEFTEAVEAIAATEADKAEGIAEAAEAADTAGLDETMETEGLGETEAVPGFEAATAIDEGISSEDNTPGFEPSDAPGTQAADNVAVSGNDNILANIDENAAVMENNLEISVDSNENIDKMGIENIVHNRNSLTIEDCINEAFRLKGTGDLEGAILHHMYALDKKPDGELTFWIILDICVMYKSLGQQELALDILNSYYETYGDTMDISVKDEIRRNLAAIQA